MPQLRTLALLLHQQAAAVVVSPHPAINPLGHPLPAPQVEVANAKVSFLRFCQGCLQRVAS